jgi:predicted nucleic acid-binding protein
MAYLVDTSVLVRLANRADLQYGVAAQAMLKLHDLGESLHVTPQNLIEFRNVATRPVKNNGLGLSIVAAEANAANFEDTLPLLPDTPEIFPKWKAIVELLGIIGKQVHDARLVAVCHVHGVKSFLTFNVAHFAALARFGPRLKVVEPADICQRLP